MLCQNQNWFRGTGSGNKVSVPWNDGLKDMYHISRPIRHTFFPENCDLNSTCVLRAEGKYYFQTYKYPHIYYTTALS